jgi:hypothetical protein
MSCVNIHVWDALMFSTQLNAYLRSLELCIFYSVVSSIVMSVLYNWFCFIHPPYISWIVSVYCYLMLVYVMFQISGYMYQCMYYSCVACFY